MSPPIGAVVVEQSPTTTTTTATPGLREQLRLALTEPMGSLTAARLARLGTRARIYRPALTNTTNPNSTRLLLVTPEGRKPATSTNNDSFGHQLVALPRRVGDLFSNLFNSGVSKI
jgi:hypothetical protein